MTYCHELTERDLHKKHEQNTESYLGDDIYQNPTFLKSNSKDFFSLTGRSRRHI